MSPVGFEPIISAGERPQTYALDRAATGTGSELLITVQLLLRAIMQNFFVLRNLPAAHFRVRKSEVNEILSRWPWV